MAGPVASNIRLPDDAANTGKRIRTIYQTIGADSVHQHFFVPDTRRKVLGRYMATSALISVQASAQNLTSTGHLWFQVPIAATIRARLKRLRVAYSMTTEVDHVTVPRTSLARFTFTGIASGATLTPGKRRSDDAAPQADVRTAMTGMTPTLVALLWSALAPSLLLTTSGLVWAATPEYVWDPADEEDYIDVAPGEGLCLYQPDAGTTSDGRRLVANLMWDEYDNT